MWDDACGCGMTLVVVRLCRRPLPQTSQPHISRDYPLSVVPRTSMSLQGQSDTGPRPRRLQPWIGADTRQLLGRAHTDTTWGPPMRTHTPYLSTTTLEPQSSGNSWGRSTCPRRPAASRDDDQIVRPDLATWILIPTAPCSLRAVPEVQGARDGHGVQQQGGAAAAECRPPAAAQHRLPDAGALRLPAAVSAGLRACRSDVKSGPCLRACLRAQDPRLTRCLFSRSV